MDLGPNAFPLLSNEPGSRPNSSSAAARSLQPRPTTPSHTPGTHSPVLDVYATPFIPSYYKAINEYNARSIPASPPKGIDFKTYTASFAGTDFLRPDPVEGIPRPPHDVAEPVGPHNYGPRFLGLLDKETAALSLQRNENALYKAPIRWAGNKTRPDLYKLEVPGLREAAFPIEVGDKVELRQIYLRPDGAVINTHSHDDRGRDIFTPGWIPTLQHDSVVWAIDRRNEYLTLCISYLEPATMMFNVRFTPQEKRQQALSRSVAAAHRAMTSNHSAWMRVMLFPEQTDGELQRALNSVHTSWPLRDELLNYEQIRAIDTVLAGRYGRLPYLISGPPGTGKTKTLVELAVQLLVARSDAHLLICAPSDPAADTLVLRLRRHIDSAYLFRLQSPARSFPEVPETVLPFCYIDNDIFCLPPFARIMRYRIIVTTCRDADMMVRARLTNADLFDLQHGMLTTMNPDKHLTPPPLHWTGLLMDEAAQAIEPEAVIPLSVVAPPDASASHHYPLVVMVGDQNQLGPRTASRTDGLQKSLFERLMERDVYRKHPMSRDNNRGRMPKLTREMLPILRPPFAKLVNNYRSHPAILAMPSAMFYNDTLEPMASGTDSLISWPEWRGDRNWPILFVDNPGTDEIEKDGGGWYNKTEANLAIALAISLMQSQPIPAERICIMAPFTAQVRLLRDLARKSSKRHPKLQPRTLNIGPIEAFQGLESDMVILCTTRSRDRFLEQDRRRGLGVLHEPRRLNVALTRARAGLVVLGNPDLLERDPHWRQVLAFCARNGHWKGRAWKGAGAGAGSGAGVVVSRLEKQAVLREQAANGGLRSLGGGEARHAAWTDGVEVVDALLEQDRYHLVQDSGNKVIDEGSIDNNVTVHFTGKEVDSPHIVPG